MTVFKVFLVWDKSRLEKGEGPTLVDIYASRTLAEREILQEHGSPDEEEPFLDIEEREIQGATSAVWALLLLERDGIQGRKVLERMIKFYEENDGRADDFGRLFIVTDAMRALGRKV